MTIKKKTKKKVVRDHLKPGEYWEWRLCLEEKAHALTALELSVKKNIILEKDLEIQKLRLSSYKNIVKSKREVYNAKNAELDSFKERIEASIGQSLEDKIIKEDFSIMEIVKEDN